MQSQAVRKPGFLSAAVLKNTAYITMFIDHFFAVVYLAVLRQYRMTGTATDTMEWIYRAGRAVGRISFILFAYLTVEGLLHTGSRRNYLLRLGIFAFVSEIPFDLAFSGKCFAPESQNVFFTLFLGMLTLTVWEWMAARMSSGVNSAGVCQRASGREHSKYHAAGRKSSTGNAAPGAPGNGLLQGILWAVQIGALIFCSAAAYFLHTDYKFMGVLLIFAFYQTRERKLSVQMAVAGCVMLFGTWSANWLRYAGEYSGVYLFRFSLREMYGLFAFFWIGLYNGKKGFQLPKPFYYGFYPVHLLFLYFVALLAAGGSL